MASMTKSSLFHRKSKGSLSISKPIIPEETSNHVRKWSSSSTISHTSTDYNQRRNERYNPLSLHPPLTFNTSPSVPEFHEVRYQEEEERESRFFNQTQYAEDHIQDLTEFSPIKGKNCYFDGPNARPYQYDQETQWPLKDWQTIPPGFTVSESASSSVTSSPTRADVPRRRNTGWMDDADMLRRGAWKRRGIVFHLDDKAEEWQERHFELPEQTVADI